MQEEYRTIDYYPMYEVSNLGNVRNKKGHIMGQTENKGYMYVMLYSTFNVTVHSLVAKIFIPNPLNLPVVHHKNHKKFPNCVDNLEWSTRSNNIKEYYKTIKFTSCSKQILQLSLDGTFIANHVSMSVAARSIGKQPSNICMCCQGVRDKAYGYKWQYLKGGGL